MRWHRIVAAALSVALVLGIGSFATAGMVTSRIYPAPVAPLTLDGLPTAARFVEVTTVDSLTLKGILVPAKPGMPLLLVFHGNASSATKPIRWLAPLIEQGYGVLAAEYRGYSGMPGKPSEPGLERDAGAFAARARLEAKGAPLWLVGHSLGSGVALNLARRERFDTVVTIGAFTRIRAMTSGLARALVPDAYRNEDNVPHLPDAYILIHGTADDLVPAGMGNTLHAAATRAGRTGASVVMIGEGHQPDAHKLCAAFDAVRSWRETGQWNAAQLPADVKLVPFGATKPLNP
jgi:uncharacterized protein